MSLIRSQTKKKQRVPLEEPCRVPMIRHVNVRKLATVIAVTIPQYKDISYKQKLNFAKV